MFRNLLLSLFPGQRVSEATKLVTVMADELVADLQGRYQLDYSVASLQDIDTMLAEAAKQTKVSGTVKELLMRRTGSYISEVARRQFGGEYTWDKQNDLPLLASGMPKFELRLHAYEKVAQRLYKNDPADNIVFFYEGFAQHYKAGMSGDIV